ncbi:SRPBCC family protein [Variovorax sp. GT1P44]|uniref:SRPBCC family protein n=1 Tax=Variovorax sp. GT1P44 TaxID=3443742 RepID=UPI003F47D41A
MTARTGALGLMLALALGGTAATAQQARVDTRGEGDSIHVTASAEMQADPRTVWNVITDYDHLAEFIPYVRSSRVLRRDGDRVLVEQTGEFTFLFFRQPVRTKLTVVESPPRRVTARAVGGSGNLREMEGSYAVESLPAGTVRLTYAGRLVPDFAVPPLIGRMVVRNVFANQFNAMVGEILRRDAESGR